MSNIQLWFNKAFEAGKHVQQQEHKGETVDGRAVWSDIESKISDLNLKDIELTGDTEEQLKYNLSLNDLYSKMDVIIEKFNMANSELDPKSNHFFMQLKNLVKAKSNFNIQLNRVAQLGFNAGQLSVFINEGTLFEDRRELITGLVNEYKMLELDTYVNTDTQSIINKKYLESKTSDIYYVKYLKYKSKYLELKSKLYKPNLD